MDASWKDDPRLKSMNREKLNLLTEFAERLEHADKSEIMETLLSVNLEARRRGIQFNDSETALIVSILSAHMPQNERKKLELLKMMSKKLTGGR